jgi:hypothetical protein
VTAVHVGPLKYCEVFLGPNANYDPKLQDKLREAMGLVLLLAKTGLQINESIIGPDQIAFQAMLDDKLQHITQEFQDNYAPAGLLNKLASNIRKSSPELSKKDS